MPRVRPVRRSAALAGQRAHLTVRWRTELEEHVIVARPSGDGALVAAAAVSGDVAILDAATGAPRHDHPGHAQGASCLDWRPGSRTLASGGHDGTVRIWDPQGCRELEAGASWVERVRWSPDGSLLAGSAGRRITIWRPDGIVLAEWPDHPSTVTDIGWSPDGSLLAATSYGGVTLWSPDAPDPVRLEWTGSSLALAWSPTGHHLATGDQDATVHFWMVTRRTDLQMSGYPTKIRELAWDSSGRHLATGGGSDVTTWDCAPPGPAGSRPSIVEGDDSLVSALSAQWRGAMIAAGSQAGRIFAFRAGASGERGRIELMEGVSSLSWFPDDAGLLAGTDAGGVFSIAVT